MSDMTNMDEQALKAFEKALEDFIQNITTHCSTMEGGISGCQKFMKDASSQKALQRGEQICTDIRSCLNPADNLLELVRSLIQQMADEPDM